MMYEWTHVQTCCIRDIIYINIYRAANKIKKRDAETAGRLQVNSPTLMLNSDEYVLNTNKSQSTEPFLHQVNAKNKQTYSETNIFENPLYNKNVNNNTAVIKNNNSNTEVIKIVTIIQQ